MKFLLASILLIFFIITSQVNASTHAKDWLKSEIDYILNIYNNNSFSKVKRFENIENTINKNFAGSGIAKFVAGKAWSKANKETKKQFITLFKRHLALNIASMMQSYSNQSYSLINSDYNEENKVILIDMEIIDQTNKILITWRVKESKNRFYVIDLMVADISLVLTKRSEFNSMLKKVDYNLKNFNETLNIQNELSYYKIIK